MLSLVLTLVNGGVIAINSTAGAVNEALTLIHTPAQWMPANYYDSWSTVSKHTRYQKNCSVQLTQGARTRIYIAQLI